MCVCVSEKGLAEVHLKRCMFVIVLRVEERGERILVYCGLVIVLLAPKNQRAWKHVFFKGCLQKISH